MEEKKALLVKVNLLVRVIVDSDVDPEVDSEFELAVMASVKSRIQEEGVSFIAEAIEDYNDDIENPYDSEYDN
jgi:hypothetical protein